MLSNLVSLFQSTFVHAEVDADPAAGAKRRLASLPQEQAEPLVANDDLRGFLKSVFRLHEEARIPDDEWTGIAHFLMRVRKHAPGSVRHLEKQWPQAVASWATVRDLLRTPRFEASELPGKTIAKLRTLLDFLKHRARKQSWLSHGFDVEFHKMADDRAIVAAQRIEVLQLAALRVGPMDSAQLQAARQRIAAMLELLPTQAYPCIRDVLSRVSNEATWQLAMFKPAPDAGTRDTPSSTFGSALNAAACP